MEQWKGLQRDRSALYSRSVMTGNYFSRILQVKCDLQVDRIHSQAGYFFWLRIMLRLRSILPWQLHNLLFFFFSLFLLSEVKVGGNVDKKVITDFSWQ